MSISKRIEESVVNENKSSYDKTHDHLVKGGWVAVDTPKPGTTLYRNGNHEGEFIINHSGDISHHRFNTTGLNFPGTHAHIPAEGVEKHVQATKKGMGTHTFKNIDRR